MPNYAFIPAAKLRSKKPLRFELRTQNIKKRKGEKEHKNADKQRVLIYQRVQMYLFGTGTFVPATKFRP